MASTFKVGDEVIIVHIDNESDANMMQSYINKIGKVISVDGNDKDIDYPIEVEFPDGRETIFNIAELRNVKDLSNLEKAIYGI